jgi:accessory gene regulator protein AgrB
LQPNIQESNLSNKKQEAMIILAKLTLFILWLAAFCITCLVMGIVFPLITIFEKLQTAFEDGSVG